MKNNFSFKKRKKNPSTKPIPTTPSPQASIMGQEAAPALSVHGENQPYVEGKELLLPCIHKSHGVNGSFWLFPSNQVLASGTLAGIESSRPRGG